MFQVYFILTNQSQFLSLNHKICDLSIFFFPQVVVLLLAVAVSVTGDIERQHADGYCNKLKTLQGRHHSVSILEFGAVGDGKTLNTVAFQNAIFYLKSFADKGGAMLYVPSGKWLTGSFNLTSHLTLFLEKDSVILASQVLNFLCCTLTRLPDCSFDFFLLGFDRILHIGK